MVTRTTPTSTPITWFSRRDSRRIPPIDRLRGNNHFTPRTSRYTFSVGSPSICSEEVGRDLFSRMMEDESNDGVSPTSPYSGTTSVELARKYTRAALYIRAESHECAANDRKMSAGVEAKKLILAGVGEAEILSLLENWTES